MALIDTAVSSCSYLIIKQSCPCGILIKRHAMKAYGASFEGKVEWAARAGVDAVEERDIFIPAGNRTSAVRSVARRYNN
jgi:hypothetical protein